ncbi:MAG: hypothetical protein O9262_09225 [Cyclobacteriaceae bacterium]|nr:hypothetical protein [Cyclobacteriaceae bacterium]
MMILFQGIVFSHDLISGGTNSWVFHPPDDGRTSMFVAPMINGVWDFSKQVEFFNNGKVQFSKDLYSLQNIFSYKNIQAVDGFSLMNASYSVDILKYQTGQYPNNTGFIFRTEKGGAGGSSVKVDALKILHEGQAQFISDVSMGGSIFLLNQGYSVDILKNQTGPYPNNTGFLFRTEKGGPNGSSVKVDAMTIDHHGNVGIGTNPNQKLHVNGTVYSTEVKVDVNAGTGPDYVFEPTYQLSSLAEIENYIKANKHLPEVPSAKEMETNGINLSEMNMLLLKKVEELTLHLIEQKKEINELRSEIRNSQNKK